MSRVVVKKDEHFEAGRARERGEKLIGTRGSRKYKGGKRKYKGGKRQYKEGKPAE